MGDLDLTLCFITSQLKWQEPADIHIQPNDKNGLKKLSLIRLSKIATIDKALVIGRLGNLDPYQIEILNNNLKVLLKLS